MRLAQAPSPGRGAFIGSYNLVAPGGVQDSNERYWLLLFGAPSAFLSENLMKLQELATFAIATWGALISTILATIKVMEFRQGSTNIHVRVARDMKIHPQNPTYGDKSYLVITAANRGQRPVYLGTAGLIYRKTWRQHTGGCVAVDSLRNPQPVKLEEGEARDFLIEPSTVDKDVGHNGYVAFVKDRAGRTFHSHGLLGRLVRVRSI